MPKRIYCAFTFFNELELLDLRLRESWAKIDGFVVCEATRTQMGANKPLIFAQNQERFKQYMDKITHVVVEDMPAGSAWDRERHQRNAIRRGLPRLHPEDVVIICDADEIVSNDALDYVRQNDGYFVFDMALNEFYMNMMARGSGWSKAFGYSWRLDSLLQDYNRPRESPDAVYESFAGQRHWIKPGGWHFSYLGGPERVRYKMRSCAHATDKWSKALLAPGETERQLALLRKVDETGSCGTGEMGFLTYCEIDDTFPAAVRADTDHHVRAGLVISAKQRIQSLEHLCVLFELERLTAPDPWRTASLSNALGMIPTLALRAARRRVPQWLKSRHRTPP